MDVGFALAVTTKNCINCLLESIVVRDANILSRISLGAGLTTVISAAFSGFH